MRAIISKDENNKWIISTYKSKDIADALLVRGNWKVELKKYNVKNPVRWVVDHSNISVLSKPEISKYPKIKAFFVNRDKPIPNLTNSPLIFTDNGVFVTDLKPAAPATAISEAFSRAEAKYGSDFLTKLRESAEALQEAESRTQKTLEEFYYNKYGKPKDDKEAISLLCTIYEEQMRMPITPEICSGIGEYYRLIAKQGFPAFHWLVEAISVTSKKASHKRNFRYIAGIIRSWLKFGFGYIPFKENTDILELFKKTVRTEISKDAQNLIRQMLGQYGVVKCASAIPELRGVDHSFIMAVMLKDILEKKYTN